jgi:hypothetical protein
MAYLKAARRRRAGGSTVSAGFLHGFSTFRSYPEFRKRRCKRQSTVKEEYPMKSQALMMLLLLGGFAFNANVQAYDDTNAGAGEEEMRPRPPGMGEGGEQQVGSPPSQEGGEQGRRPPRRMAQGGSEESGEDGQGPKNCPPRGGQGQQAMSQEGGQQDGGMRGGGGR